jgi:hypothetical protein
MIHELVIGIASSIFGAIAVLVVQTIYKKIEEFNGDYSGIWKDSIYDDSGNIVKSDNYEVRQKGETLRGTIERIYPSNQRHRRYKFEGRVRSGVFFAIFWSLDQTVPSNGCWYMRQTHDGRFEGFYLKLQENDANKIVPIRINMEQVSHARRPKWLPQPIAQLLRAHPG